MLTCTLRYNRSCDRIWNKGVIYPFTTMKIVTSRTLQLVLQPSRYCTVGGNEDTLFIFLMSAFFEDLHLHVSNHVSVFIEGRS